MINHLSIGVRNLQRSMAFYDAVLATLDYCRVWTGNDAAGYGYPNDLNEPFSIKLEDESANLGTSPRSHLAFEAATRAMVLAFHEVALRSGGSDMGAPGPRPHYGENYFAAFVRDPDGYRIEAVCLKAGPETRGLEEVAR